MKNILFALTLVALLTGPTSAATFYWDTDGTSAGNDISSGAGLGGAGDWNATTTNWWDGVASSALVTWPNNDDAVFTGVPGVVVIPDQTVVPSRVATGLTFKTDGYEVSAAGTGSTGRGTLNLVVPANLIADPFVTAAITARLTGTVGYKVSGGGTIRLAEPGNLNSVTGPVSVTGGSVLELIASGQIGGTGTGSGNVTLDNGTFRNTNTSAGVLLLTANRQIIVGAGGGTLDTPGSTQILLYSGIISGATPGTGTLTKTGPGEIRMNGGPAQVFTFEKLVIKDGQYTLGQSVTLGVETALGAVPAAPLADAVTLDGGTTGGTETLRFVGGTAETNIMTHPNRGFSLINGGGTIRTDVSNATIQGVITGDGGLTKIGGLYLALTAANTYTGVTNINGGTIRANNTTGSATGSGQVLVNNLGSLAGTGSVSGAVDVASGGRIAAGIGNANETLDTTTVTMAFGGILDALVGATGSDVLRVNTADGLTVNGGILNVGAGPATGNPAGQTFTLVDYNGTIGGDFNNFLINNATGYDATVTNDTVATEITVTVSNTAHDKTWTFDGDGNWGPQTADAGNWTSPGQPNGPSAIARFLGAATAPRTITLSDVSVAVGTLILDNANAYTIAATSPNRLVFNTYSGNATLNVVSGSHTISAPITFIAPTNVTVPTGETLTSSAAVSNGPVANSGGFTKLGAGNFIIEQNNWTGFGPTIINEGTLTFATTNAGLGNVSQVTIATGATLDMNFWNDTVDSLVGGGSIVNGGNLTLSGTNTTPAEFIGSFSGTNASRTFTKNGAGTQILTNGANRFTSAVIGGGTLRVNNTSGSATGPGAVSVNNTGTLGGTGFVDGAITVASGGAIAPGSGGIGTLTANSDLTLNSGSITRFELNTVAGVDVGDKIIVEGTLALGATAGNRTVNLTNLGGMTGGDYTLIDYATLTGLFTNLVLGATQPAGFGYQLMHDTINTLILVRVELLGDYNNNGTVDAADFVVWRENEGQNFDLPNDGVAGPTLVGATQYDLWRSNFGNSPGLGSGVAASQSLSAVPEPGSLMLVLLGLMAVGAYRRR